MQGTAKVAIVTGASGGIGAAVAERLAAAGFSVIVTFAHDPEPANNVVAEIERAGAKATAVRGDVSDSQAVGKLFDAAVATYGEAGFLLNAGGVMHLTPIVQTDDESFEWQIVTNRTGIALRPNGDDEPLGRRRRRLTRRRAA